MTTETIWEQFSGRLLQYINSKIGNRSDAEDVRQDVFLKIHKNLATLKNLKKVESWIFQITRNAINDYFRHHDVHETLRGEPRALQEEDQNFKKEIFHCLIGLTDQLPEKYQKPLKAIYMEGKTHKAIAEEIGLSLPGAKSRVQRGRSKLKKILDDCCRIESIIDTMDCCHDC